ncbi:MAG: PQQ-binding-like beta-propeller repeat protein [Verrucomicrobiales bacterium]|nr:PQQ-binding-like beta-propeller repeat protein [Verrucomicrobiales bacterium]MCP5557481.1 PQQ-binding-like beta-propeller repeat protein [Verrucomicrobiaceae bacterium]
MKVNTLLLSIAVVTAVQAADWPEWRGAGGQGVARDSGSLPTTWSATSGVNWMATLPGRGHSTPVIEGERIWLTTAIETKATAEEAERRLKDNTGDQPLTLLAKVSLRAVCVDRASGKVLHDIELIDQPEPQWAHQLNSYASPSPIVENGFLYCHFGTFGTVCLDTATLAIKWKNTELHVMHENGPGSTPVLWQDRLIVHFDGSDAQFIAAFDKATGKVLWKTPRSGEMDPRPQQRKAYGTPLMVDIEGAPTVVSPAANWVYGYDPATGAERWKIPYGELGFSMSVRPVADDQRIYFSTSFGKSQVIALDYAGKKVPEIAWRSNKNAPKMSSPLIVDGLLYYVDDGGIVTCVDSATGEGIYKERLGGKFSSSPIHADGKLYFCSREGVVTVLPAGKEFKVLAQNDMGSPLMASPVAVDGLLYLRAESVLFCIGKSD